MPGITCVSAPLHERMSLQPKSPFEETLLSGHEYTVISLHPIWAWAVLFAGKDVDNRSWTTEQRGRVLIHASGHKLSIREDLQLRAELSFLSGIAKSALPVPFERSAILGSVEIVDCIQAARSKWAVRGNNHWLLRDPRPLASPVVGVDGELQFWRWKLEADAAQ